MFSHIDVLLKVFWHRLSIHRMSFGGRTFPGNQVLYANPNRMDLYDYIFAGRLRRRVFCDATCEEIRCACCDCHNFVSEGALFC